MSDYLPTVLELLGVPHEHPDWVADGMSLLPLIKTLAAKPDANDTSTVTPAHSFAISLTSLLL